MSMKSWLASLRPALCRNLYRTIRCSRLVLEALEDRTAPAITVTTLADTGAGSLRQALATADTQPGPDTINFIAGLTGTINLASELGVRSTVTVTGPGETSLTIAGGGTSSNFSVVGVAAGVTATISGLTIANGNRTASFIGAGVTNLGTLTLTDVTLSGNRAVGGGGIANVGTLTLNDVTLSGNAATGNANGGAGVLNIGTLTINNSTFSDNHADASLGGGVFSSGTLTVNDTEFFGNQAVAGGGIANYGGTLTLDDSTLSGNKATFGGGVYNTKPDPSSIGLATLDNVKITGNTATDQGGGFANFLGSASLIDVTVSDNKAKLGGGVLNNRGALTLADCTLSLNSATDGGGFYNANTGTATLTNVTIAGNSADSSGGGVFVDNALTTLTNVSIANNSGFGGGIRAQSGAVTLNNTIVADNTAGGFTSLTGIYNYHSNIEGSVGGFNNLIGDTKSNGGLINGVNGNILIAGGQGSGLPGTPLFFPPGSVAGLGPLTDNGGPTQTIALLPGSPALDNGNAGLAVNPQGQPLTSDQRDLRRAVGAGRVDIGAFESSTLVVKKYTDTLLVGSDGSLSLRTALAEAATMGGSPLITFDLPLITYSGGVNQFFSGRNPLFLSSGLVIASDVTIEGPTDWPLILVGGGGSSNFSVLTIAAGVSATISELTIANGRTNSDGGGIKNAGNLTLNDVTLSGVTTKIYSSTQSPIDLTIAGNSAAFGGGIFNTTGSLMLTDCTLSGNTANSGGGIFNHNGYVGLANDTLVANAATFGGGVFNEGGSVTLTNCTLAFNSSSFGGGVNNIQGSTLQLTNCTLFGNSAATNGGGINNAGLATLNNTIVANSGPGGCIFGVVSGFNNLIDNPASAGGLSLGNILGVNPQLGPLEDNGGPTQTMALLPLSPANNAGSNALAVDAFGNPLFLDARGVPRRFGAAVDIGAFETVPTIVVTTALDTDDSGDGAISLREALKYAEIEPGPDDITFALGLASPIVLSSGLDIDSDVTISGSGAASLTVSGGGLDSDFSVITVSDDATATIIGLTIANGSKRTKKGDTRFGASGVGFGSGGGIANKGTLTLIDVAVTDNFAFAIGGGIDNDAGFLTLINVTVANNRSSIGSGGGIASTNGGLTMTNVTLAGNFAGGDGGGLSIVLGAPIPPDSGAGVVYVDNSRPATLTNVTIFGNTANGGLRGGGYGGGIYFFDGVIFPAIEALTLTNVTVAGNKALLDGGGIYYTLLVNGSQLRLNNSIVANNTDKNNPTAATDIEFGGAVGVAFVSASSSHNLIGNAATAGGLVSGVNGNIVGAAALLGPLADNGGPTDTMALLPGSPAINAGSNALAVDAFGFPLTTDQRDTGFARVFGSAVDIGAYEVLTTATATTTTMTANPLATTGGTLVQFTATIAPSPGGLGTVTFLDNGVPIPGGSNIAISGGVATFSASFATNGTHPITAAYSGAASFTASTSAPVNVVVSAVAPPQVLSVTPNANIAALAGAQRSRVVSLVVAFNQAVQIDASALTLALHATNVGYGGAAMPSGFGTLATLVPNTADNITWTATFTGNTDNGADGYNSLKDGVYDFIVSAAKVHPLGAPSVNMAANSTTTFHRLAGDTGAPTTPTGGAAGIDFQAIVNTGDNLTFRAAFNKPAGGYQPFLDFNGDGIINTADNLQFRSRFNKALTWRV